MGPEGSVYIQQRESETVKTEAATKSGSMGCESCQANRWENEGQAVGKKGRNLLNTPEGRGTVEKGKGYEELLIWGHQQISGVAQRLSCVVLRPDSSRGAEGRCYHLGIWIRGSQEQGGTGDTGTEVTEECGSPVHQNRY